MDSGVCCNGEACCSLRIEERLGVRTFGNEEVKVGVKSEAKIKQDQIRKGGLK